MKSRTSKLCPSCDRGQKLIQPPRGMEYDCGSVYVSDQEFLRTDLCRHESRRLASESLADATDRVTRALWSDRVFTPCGNCGGIGQVEVIEKATEDGGVSSAIKLFPGTIPSGLPPGGTPTQDTSPLHHVPGGTTTPAPVYDVDGEETPEEGPEAICTFGPA